MTPARLIFERQCSHLLGLGLLLGAFYGATRLDAFAAGSLCGVGSQTWAWLSVGIAVLHQVFVWFCLRVELYLALCTRWIGRHAFRVYAILFMVMLVARPVLISLLAIANRDTVPLPRWLGLLLAGALSLPTLYLFYSVIRYFGFRRAMGIDHFERGYRKLPLVREGIFRFTRNGMYTFGFLLVWIPGLAFSSFAALAVAAFSHAYIWVHYLCTERPDMTRIYGEELGGPPRAPFDAGLSR